MVAVFVQMGDAAMKEGCVVAEQGMLDGCLRNGNTEYLFIDIEKFHAVRGETRRYPERL